MVGEMNLMNHMLEGVFIYESKQFPNFAFYATPLLDIDTDEFTSLYNNSDGTKPYLTSAEKDYDGDGVSDFWEVALGFPPDNGAVVPDIANPNTFINLSNQDFSSRLVQLEDFQDIQWDASSTPVNNLEFEALRK